MLFLEPNIDLAMFILRLGVGIVFLTHGPAKLQRAKHMGQAMDMSTGQVLTVGVLETLGAASLILGMWPQLGALLLIIVMLGSIYTKTQKWGKAFTGESGWELDFALLVAALTIFLGTPATYSLIG